MVRELASQQLLNRSELPLRQQVLVGGCVGVDLLYGMSAMPEKGCERGQAKVRKQQRPRRQKDENGVRSVIDCGLHCRLHRATPLCWPSDGFASQPHM